MSVAVIILYYYQINDFRYLELLSYFFTLALSLFSNGPTSRNIKQYWPHWPHTTVVLSVWTNLGKNFVVRLDMRLKYKDGHKIRLIMRKLSFEMGLERRTKKGSSSGYGRIMRLEDFSSESGSLRITGFPFFSIG